MEKAFTYMFKDDKFLNKAGGYFLLFFISQLCYFLCSSFSEKKIAISSSPILLLCFFIGFFITIILSGYSFNVIKSIILKKENIILPYINFSNNIRLGLKWFASTFLLISVICAICLSGVVLLHNIPSAKLWISLFYFLILILFFFICLIFAPALIVIFTKTEKITSIFRFGLASKLIANNSGNYFAGFGILIIIGIIFISLSLFGSFFMLVYPFLSTYIIYVIAYIYAKMVDTDLIEAETEEL